MKVIYGESNYKKIKGRRLLYEIIKGLPKDYIDSVKKKLKEEEKLKNSLK